MKKPLNEQFRRMQKLAGILNENELKEDQNAIDKILDKISISGIESLTPEEKKYLNTGESPEISLEQDKDYFLLTPQVMEYINEKIQEMRNKSDEEQWEYLKEVEYWEQDFEDELLVDLGDKYPNAYMISQDVQDYIWEKVNYYDNKRFK